ncbi:hypothetical protein J2045_003521 [Peteryoungia aggregata LMG 23059]|uniref:Uncharacterized protein n=1 Tax=Peteryoungia aggregata LMG 23059 TaxID=1368425 RepID=A0ABU0GB00_9HYPH|nr:hypothetical protein [Peteryoungia aggregata]MDQ0422473.1 hypothetical protein [Peteryoungia aggregata LMG 23059]
MSIVMLTAVTRVERRAATSFVFDTVNRIGGWIDDVRMYSNLMNTIRLTLPAGAFAVLVAALEEGGIMVDPLQDPGDLRDAATECMATLQLTFIHDEPDLKREVPTVPG